jgi:hypothetical protein
MLGFLGLTADVTGFELDRGVLIGSLFFAVCIQLLKDAEATDDGKAIDLTRQKQFSK